MFMVNCKLFIAYFFQVWTWLLACVCVLFKFEQFFLGAKKIQMTKSSIPSVFESICKNSVQILKV